MCTRCVPAKIKFVGRFLAHHSRRPGHEFAFTVVHDETGREETGWRRYRFDPCGGGTVLTESFEFLWCPLGNRVVELFVPRGR